MPDYHGIVVFPTWYKKGIITLSNVLDLNGNFLTLEEKACTILSCYQIYKSSNVEILGPIMPTSIQILNKCTKGARGYYTLLKQAECNDHTMKKKWENDFSLSIDRETWNNIFNIQEHYQ